MSEKEQNAISYISTQERFSPSSVSHDCNIELTLSIKLCEQFVNVNPGISKFYQLNCPECGSFVRGMSIEEAERIYSIRCEDCGTEIDVSIDALDYYYLNPLKKKPENPNSNNAEYINTPQGIANEIDKSPSKKFLSDPQDFIWHISDLHFTPKAGICGHGHSQSLYEEFINLISKRTRIKNDLVLISGDCTDDGSHIAEKSFKKFLCKLVSLGVQTENILTVPGNHDAWNGMSRIRLAFSYLLREIYQFNKYRSYPKRNLPKIFSCFINKPLRVIKRKVNGINLEILLINSTIPKEMARGVFPTSIYRLEELEEGHKRISMMHHHLIDDLSLTTLGSETFTKKHAMRVYNSGMAIEYLINNNISISLHGHNHFQYYKIEHKLNTQNNPIHLVSAPSLLEDNFDKANGNIKDNNFIGFNLLRLKKDKFDLFFYRLNKFNYTLKHYDNISY